MYTLCAVIENETWKFICVDCLDKPFLSICADDFWTY